jgi:hypothetical protein
LWARQAIWADPSGEAEQGGDDGQARERRRSEKLIMAKFVPCGISINITNLTNGHPKDNAGHASQFLGVHR